MDTLTHALVGTAASDGWFRKRLGPLATPFALVASALPDVDVATYFVSPQTAWASHRGITHGFVPMLIAAPILGYLGYRVSRREGTWQQWSLLALICLYAHTIFDLITSWGTMPWMPFSNARISWDIVPILDIFLTAVTAASFVANRILRWERIDYFINPLTYPVVHRHPKRRIVGDWAGKIAVILVVAYLLVGWQQNRQTLRIAREELAKQGVEAVEVRALPILLTYIAWDIAARDAEGAIYNAVYSSYARGPMNFIKFDAPASEDLALVADTPQGRLFRWYSQGMFTADKRTEDGVERISMRDRRFFTLTRPRTSRFVMEFTPDAGGEYHGARDRQLGFADVDIREELRRLWDLTWDGRDMGE